MSRIEDFVTQSILLTESFACKVQGRYRELLVKGEMVTKIDSVFAVGCSVSGAIFSSSYYDLASYVYFKFSLRPFIYRGILDNVFLYI